MVHVPFSFKTILPHIDSGWQAQYYSCSGIPSYPSHCGSWLSIVGKADFQTGISFMNSWSGVSNQLEMDFLAPSCTNPCQHYYTLENLLHLEPWNWMLSTIFEGLRCIRYSPQELVPLALSKFSGKTCHRSIQPFNSRHTLLDGGCLAFNCSQHLGDIPHCCPIIKDLARCFGKLSAQGPATATFNPLASYRPCCANKGFLPQLIR